MPDIFSSVGSGAAGGSAVPGIGTAIGAGLGLLGGIGGLFSRGAANRRLQKLLSQDPVWRDRYAVNPEAEQRLGLAKQLLNARMPGAVTAERNIFTNQANTVNNLLRNATSSSQALNLINQGQGITNQSIEDLGMKEAGDAQRRQANLVGAQEGIIREGDKVYADKQYNHQDEVRRFQDAAQIQGAQAENNQNAWKSVENGGFGLMNYGLAGGFNGMFGNNMGRPVGGNMQQMNGPQSMGWPQNPMLNQQIPPMGINDYNIPGNSYWFNPYMRR